MKYILLSLSFLIPFVLFASVNDGMITGKVLSVDGDAVDYATLSLKGTGYSASTNDKGIYHLSAPAGSYTLVVNAVGFEKKEIKVAIVKGDRTKLHVKLKPSTQLSEVTVVGNQ